MPGAKDMQRKQLTDASIEALAAKRKRYVVYDSEVRSLAVRVSPRGRKTFIVVKRFNGAKHPSRRKLGLVGRMTLDQARERALKFDARPSDKFGAVAEQYFQHIQKQRRAYEVERTIRRELFPRWENKQLASITRQDVRQVIDAIKARGSPSSAHHVLTYAKGVFNYAIDHDLLEHSPCERIRPQAVIGAKTPRQRVLSDEELRALWQACNRTGEFGRLLQMIIVTGTRRNEAALARRCEFDIGKALWEVPGERNKSGLPHIVPLSQLALGMIVGEDRLFHVSGYSKSKKRFDRFMHGEMRKRNPKATLPNWTLHDLRRTVRTRLTRIMHQS
jgi:integrase